MNKTIRRNAHKKIEAIIKSAVSLKTYTLSNNFSGSEDTHPEAIRSMMNHVLSFKPSINQTSENSYTFQMHSNWWVEIKTA